MTNLEKIFMIEKQIDEQNLLIRRLENSENSPALEYFRNPSSWSVATLWDRSAAVDVINQLQIAKKDLILESG